MILFFFAFCPFDVINNLYSSSNLSYSSLLMIFLLFAFTNSSLNFCIPIVLGDKWFLYCSPYTSSSFLVVHHLLHHHCLFAPPPNDRFCLLLPFVLLFFLGTSLSGSSPSLFSAFGLVSVYFTLGLPALPLGSTCVSGDPLLDEALHPSLPLVMVDYLSLVCLAFVFYFVYLP